MADEIKDISTLVEEETPIDSSKIEAIKNSLVEDFNKAFNEYAELTIDEGEEFKKVAKKDFDDFGEEIKNKEYEVANKEHALEVAEFLQKWNANQNRWEAQGWKGIIYFDKYITDKIAALKENEDTLKFNQGSLMFVYGSMMKPQGFGLESAKIMETLEKPTVEVEDPKNLDIDNVITYSTILEKLGRNIDWLKVADAKMQILQQRWAMAESGLKMDLKITELEEFKKFLDAINDQQKPAN